MDVHQQYGDDVAFIGVPGSNDVGSIQDFVERTGSDAITHVIDSDGAIWSSFDVRRRQTYLLIDANGTVTDVDFGDLTTSVSDVAG